MRLRFNRMVIAHRSAAAKKAEPRHEPEIAMARFRMDSELGDPGYGYRSIRQEFEHCRSAILLMIAD